MLEPTLVLTGGWSELKKMATSRSFRIGKELPVCRRGVVSCALMPVGAAQAHDRAGVQLHVGAPGWPRAYEVSENLHR